jgi:hypothetical protein
MTSTHAGSTTVVAEQTKPVKTVVHKEPLKQKGVLNAYKHFDVTPVIGREFPEVNLKSLLRAENSDDLIRDLAITGKSDMITRISGHYLTSNSLRAWCGILPQAG